MTISATPGQNKPATLSSTVPGLVGTLGYRVIDAESGELVIARTTSGITEPVPGVYIASVTAPALAGAYLLIWDEPDFILPIAEDFIVAPVTSGGAGPDTSGGDTPTVDIGDLLTPTQTWESDPTLVVLRIKPPYGDVLLPTVTRVSAGVYAATWSPTIGGMHEYRWEATGDVVDVVQSEIFVRRDNV